MLNHYYSWPDHLPDYRQFQDLICQIEILIRTNQFSKAEALITTSILSNLQQGSNQYLNFQLHILRFLLYSSQENLAQEQLAFEALSTLSVFQTQTIISTFLRFRLALDLKDPSLPTLVLSLTQYLDNDELPFCLLHLEYLLLSGDNLSAETTIQSIPNKWQDTLEYSLLSCYLLERSNRWDLILEILLSAAYKATSNVKVWSYLLVATVEARSHEHAIPSLRKAIVLHGDNPLFFSHYCRLSLLKFRSADARRYSIKDRLSKLTKDPYRNPFLTNLWVTQDRLGNSEWINHFTLSEFRASAFPLAMLEPLLPQIASINGSSSLSESIIAPILDNYENSETSPFCYSSALATVPLQPSDNKSLRIAWISADVSHHPVARFLLGFFASVSVTHHDHILVDVNDHGSESIRRYFDELSSINAINCSSPTLPERIQNIRNLEADIAIDLNGWTGGHLLRGFHQRLAPIQLNYLGYFASTGIPAMDYWLGDHNLFPDPYSHWHTERLLRLQRCFIAWQPPEPLVEATIPVVESSNQIGIRFGSFNHNRKLSNATLRLWAQILDAIPDSRLVLKASPQDDPSTEELLRRRILKNNLDPESIVWLPRTKTHADHLLQYSHIDISLDCFPNGGCTTTCESLWMGCPVITLSGTSYVSRMSTAVLCGAGLQNWCMSTPQDYLNFAIHQSQNLQSLRANRDQWRSKVLSSDLGDAASLVSHLESLFSSLLISSR
ncbi:hypothetical protein FZZ91_01180 [Synechococcus sp. HB1133]|uniref:O-linked N-acetylglucosamine transferase, SPINDLY family protein n=1 Tax=unclassified Synechococcus TaxID=2626047 RepID=UPI00140E0040|nr:MULTISPECIES: hypothetical protein [unclassified Synechococcus]MCB4421450.1 hypothetical protein [Synechococcus sp. HB1133]MCB4431199.1 hypothetical protein [Synechococcus sp. HBA1120]NHI80392.1 hypothetical protein [Synechococcus sp. HB1133]